MRLTGGLDRGRRLFVPRGSRTRPTAAKVREAIFNILGPPPGPVLDLYAGSGALGLEALSRGATSAVFVERDGAALSALRRNLREAAVETRGPDHPGRRARGRSASWLPATCGFPGCSWIRPT